MKLVMLRAKIKETEGVFEGQYAKHDDFYEDAYTSSDYYTVLCSALINYYDNVEMWFQEDEHHKAGTFTHKAGLVERFCKKDWEDVEEKTDILFVRGNIDNYRKLLDSTFGKRAFKVYYSAGNYFIPDTKYKWGLVFVDDERHIEKVRAATNCPVELFKKSCVDKYFPKRSKKGLIDIYYTCNAPQHSIKGFDIFADLMRGFKKSEQNIKAYCVGLKSNELLERCKDLDNIYFTGFIPRHHVGNIMSNARLGLVLSNTRDGSPRVIQEYLCCGLPLVVFEGTACSDFYLNTNTGTRTSLKNLRETILFVLENSYLYDPRTYFFNNLKMEHSAKYVYETISKYYSTFHNS